MHQNKKRRLQTAMFYSQANPESRRSTFRWNAAPVLREEAEYRCVAAGGSQEFALRLQVHFNKYKYVIK